MKSYVWKCLALSLIYALFAKLGLFLATLNDNVSPVWPATGIAFAILFHLGARAWPAVFAGAFIANFLTDIPLPATFFIAVGNTLEAVAGVAILRKILKYRDTLSFQTETLAVSLASGAGSVIAATIGVSSLWIFAELPTSMLVTVWSTWWVGDAIGGLVITPLLMRLRDFTFPKLEFNYALVAAAGIASFYFVFILPQGHPFLFLLFPALLLCILLNGEKSVLFLSILICAGGVLATFAGVGPFANGQLNERLVHLQLFLASIGLTALMLVGFGKANLKWLSTSVLLSSWFLTGVIFFSFESSEREKTQNNFRAKVAAAETDINNTLNTYEKLLRSGSALFSASQSVSRSEWRTFSQIIGLTENYPSVTGVGVIIPVSKNEKTKFERQMRAEGLSGYEIAPVPGFAFNSGSARPHYPIRYIEPINENIEALGLDISTEPARLEMAEKALETGRSAMTSPIKISHGGTRVPGFFLFLPFYKDAKHEGWIFGRFITEKFYSNISELNSRELTLEVYDGEQTDEKHLIFKSATDLNAGQQFKSVRKVRLGNRETLMIWRNGPAFISSHNTIVAWVSFCGALSSLLLTNLMLSIQLVGKRSRELADELTKELTLSREKFKEGERRLLYALDGSNDGIWDWNIANSEMYVSGGLCQKYGWPQKFKCATVRDMKKVTHPEDLADIQQSIDSLLAGKTETHEVETRYITKDGEYKWVLSRGKISEYDLHGNATRMTGVHIDIHDLKMMQAALEETQVHLKRAELEAVEATNVKSKFLANMSHEIRTPLNGIIGIANLLKSTVLSPQQTEYAEIIDRSSNSLLTLINDILDISKIEAGKLTIENIDFDLPLALSDAYKSFLFSAKKKHVEFHYDCDIGTHAYYKGDPGRLTQVLNNLLSNAIKFTEKGAVSLKVRILKGEKEDRFRFEVTDSGIGIHRDAVGKMFQAFTQADTSTSRKFGGTGLGLSISKQLVEMMNGQIGVESRFGYGSTFWFEIPLVKGVAPEVGEAETVNPGFANARILVAEDNKVNQLIAIDNLKNSGLDCVAVENGREAFEALLKEKFDLVLMDCQMPEMDGYQATAAIRGSLEEFRTVPIIAMTANAFKGDKEKCLAAGMNDYISKPFKKAELLKLLQKHLKKETLDRSALEQIARMQKAGSPDLLTRLIKIYIESAEIDMNRIRNAKAAQDLKALCEAAHSLKSSSANLGAVQLAQVCAEIERLSEKNASQAELTELLEQLETEYAKAITALGQVRKAA